MLTWYHDFDMYIKRDDGYDIVLRGVISYKELFIHNQIFNPCFMCMLAPFAY